jgi:hypothetical protein
VKRKKRDEINATTIMRFSTSVVNDGDDVKHGAVECDGERLLLLARLRSVVVVRGHRGRKQKCFVIFFIIRRAGR